MFETRGLDVSALPETTAMERPRNPEHGDYASTLALQLGKKVGVAPRELAAALAEELGRQPGVKSVEIAGPGFLNIRLDAAAAGVLAREIVQAGQTYGHSGTLTGERINLEFVSANPTGPVHIGGVRWAAVGDALSRILRAAGAEVGTEYYFNDAGSQIDRFAKSLLAAAKGEPAPEDGYGGAYIAEIATQVVAAEPDVLAADEPLETFRRVGVELMFTEIKASLTDFGVHFDTYFNEKDLHDRGELQEALDRLREQGHIFEKDGATWLRTSEFGDDKDRVLRKSDGDWTYFAADCAYYLDKRKRGFDRVVIMLGADHHGYVGRLKAACQPAFGDDPAKVVEVLIGQLVNLDEATAFPLRMSKRAGNGRHDGGPRRGRRRGCGAVLADPVRRPTRRSTSTSTCWTSAQQRDNPVFYVQYVARPDWRTLARNAADLGLTPRGREFGLFHPELLTRAKENDLIKHARRVPGRRRLAPPSCANRTGSPATSRRSPGRTTGSTTSAGCSPRATTRSPTCSAAGCGSTTPPVR